ncbi:hypothetical protein [Lacticaseibacillus kribbianus]|uniref:hypothetical protein n=1 Tax=Lacticaseibacillus kribbianus TaxID=2926292 RepID=UPI001CD6042E|nr:hypothetical protein [Lacticaseibacillus kribbianus]
MLIFKDSQLTEAQTGTDAVQALIDALPARTEENFIGLNGYRLAWQNGTPDQRAALNAIVIPRLTAAAKSVAAAKPLPPSLKNRSHNHALNIARNWLAGFAEAADLPQAVRDAATVARFTASK